MVKNSKILFLALLLALIAGAPAMARGTKGAKGASGANLGVAKGVKGGDMGFSIKSADFKDGQRVPRRFTCEGEDISPELSWEGAPEGTESLALIVEDPDAPMGTFIHWVIYNLPPDLKGLRRGASGSGAIKEGVSSFGRIGYNGPCPPPGHGDHRYYFRLRALDVKELDVTKNANKGDVEEAMNGHILAETSLMGIYSR